MIGKCRKTNQHQRYSYNENQLDENKNRFDESIKKPKSPSAPKSFKVVIDMHEHSTTTLSANSSPGPFNETVTKQRPIGAAD